ncbi:hypothetical protein B0H34DRAFT_794318 [Crassisporium funariophilum]|nr:hypothetical protein B0H34DRAFT_794318 [Crassisporium funariophilum]
MSLYNASGTPLDIGLENAIFQEQSVIYVYVALAAAVVYDHITTLDLEVELIWVREPGLKRCHHNMRI